MPQLLTAAWLHVPIPVALLLLVGAFAAHGRGVGAGVKGARSVGSLALLVLSHGLAGLPGLVMALGWAISRTLDFKPGDATPQTMKELLSAAKRQTPVFVAACIPLVIDRHWAMIPAALLYIAVFLALAKHYGDLNAEAKARGVDLPKSANVPIELGQGAAMGAAVWAGLMVL